MSPVSRRAGAARYSVSSGLLYDDDDRTWSTIGAPPSAPDESGASLWVGGRLLVIGGVSWASERGERNRAVWLFSPPA